ncbi:MAG TPA: hypothetical protein VM121_05735 [Acidimicrobiales bacterium]|nr:hypothetical protein [Acidimicrobiales bacterium]
MRTVRRAGLAVALAGIAAAALRLRGSNDVPGQGGGWRELSDTDLR